MPLSVLQEKEDDIVVEQVDMQKKLEPIEELKTVYLNHANNTPTVMVSRENFHSQSNVAVSELASSHMFDVPTPTS